MKNFIYLDTDYLHSFLAQLQDGHISSITEEIDAQTESSEQRAQNIIGARETYETSGSLKSAIPILNAKTEARITGTPSSLDTQIQEGFKELEASKQIVVRIVHDNVFLQFEAAVRERGLVCEDNNFKVGKYMALSGTVKIFDLDSYRAILDDEFIAAIAAAENQEKTGNFSPPPNYKTDKSFKYIRSIMDALDRILPSSIILQSGDFIIPIKERFLRETKKEIVFKYGKQLNIFGVITKENPFDTPIDSLFKDVYPKIGKSLGSMGLDIPTEGAYVLAPIAIYFEPTF